jgi:succinate dehydrogenase / fumarate reductase cytochrome b subunit
MSLLQSLNRATFGSSIGKKLIVAVTGILLIGFLLGHLLGNLQVFLAPEWINAYGHHLQTFPLLWGIRLGLLGIFALHIFTTILLIRENRAARGAQGYAMHPKKYSTLAARTMALSGLSLIAFVVFHILHFTAKTTDPEYRTMTTELHGEIVPDVHTMMVTGFQKPVYSAVYIVAMGLLCLHLSHGFSSLWQTFGLNSQKVEKFWKNFGYAFSAAIFLGYTSIPIAVMAGVIKKGGTAVPIEKQDPMSVPALHGTPADEVSNPNSTAPVMHQH